MEVSYINIAKQSVAGRKGEQGKDKFSQGKEKAKTLIIKEANPQR